MSGQLPEGLAAALALNGEIDEARSEVRRLLEIDPAFSLQRWVERGPFRRTKEHQRFFYALRLAGLPE
jgi:hypothetical protein